MFQSIIAFSIVALTALWLGWRVVKKHLAFPLANWCLRRGHVKWAMRLRALSGKSGCANCH